jgi:hypothetical protein
LRLEFRDRKNVGCGVAFANFSLDIFQRHRRYSTGLCGFWQSPIDLFTEHTDELKVFKLPATFMDHAMD